MVRSEKSLIAGISRLSFVLSLISLALSPFYFWESGVPQPSHIVLGTAIVVQFLTSKLIWEQWWIWAGLFVVYALVVDLIVYILYADIYTLLSPFYYAFNFLVWIHIINIGLKTGVGRFLRAVELVLWVSLFLQLILVFSELGRMYGGNRAMGTFNDPNQMANWLIWTAIILGIIAKTLNGSWAYGIIAWAAASLATLRTASRSGSLGFLVMALIYVYIIGSKGSAFITGRAGFRLKAVLATLLIFVFFLMVLMATGQDLIRVLISVFEDIFSILIERLHIDLNFLVEERGYDRLWKFPEYLLLGAGEGANQRWAKRTWFLGEIHSTLATVMFCYGIPGFVFLFTFFYNAWLRLGNTWRKLFLLAPLIYGMGIYNLRNFFFWFGLAVLYVSAQHRENKNRRFYYAA